MRRVLLSLAVVALVGLAADTAFGGRTYRGYGGGYYGGGYGQRNGYYSRGRSYGYNPNSFTSSVQRVRAKYSNYRYNPHPRSNFKSGPNPYAYWGW